MIGYQQQSAISPKRDGSKAGIYAVVAGRQWLFADG